MSWGYEDPRAVPDAPTLVERLSRTFQKLAQVVRCQEGVAKLPYGTTVRPSGNLAQVQLIEVTNGTPFTVANPSNAREGVEITLDFWNHSGGAMGTVSFGSEFRLDGAFVAPGNGDHALYRFYAAIA